MLQNYSSLTQKYDKNSYPSLRQKRLRHLNLISANNLKIPSDIKKFNIWYTLHKNKQTKAFYVSDQKENEFNPKWPAINHSRIQHEYLTLKEFVLRIWFKSTNKNDSTSTKLNLLLEMNVSLDGLVQLTDDYLNDTIKTTDNMIIFDLNNKHHYTELLIQNQQQNQMNEYQLLVNSLKLQQLNRLKFKQSYQLTLLMRLNEFENVIYNTLRDINRLKQIIRKKFSQTSKLNELKIKKELYLQRIQLLKAECENKKLNLLNLNNTNQNLSEKNLLLKKSCLEKQKQIEIKSKNLDDITIKNDSLLNELINLKNDLIIKQKQLIKNLNKIYPIENLLSNSSGGNEINIDQQLKIINIYLPNSKFYLNSNEQEINVALGYVCHCLLVLCYILNIPLRHPIIYRASKSTIINYTHDRNFFNTLLNSAGAGGSNNNSNGLSNGSANGEYSSSNGQTSNENLYLQELALYRSNSTQEQTFSYAVFLLNKNLAQLRLLFDNYKNFDFNNTLGSLFWLLNHS